MILTKQLRFHKGPIWLRTSTTQSLYCLLLRGAFSFCFFFFFIIENSKEFHLKWLWSKQCQTLKAIKMGTNRPPSKIHPNSREKNQNHALKHKLKQKAAKKVEIDQHADASVDSSSDNQRGPPVATYD